MVHCVFRLDDGVALLPVLHGSGDFALEVRRFLLNSRWDCLAIPLPSSFRAEVLTAVRMLPLISVVAAEEGNDNDSMWNYVPIDPCQPVIMAIRIALEEYLSIEFIDRETQIYEPESYVFPDPYSLKTVSLEKFCAAVLPTIQSPIPGSQQHARILTMTNELHQLRSQYKNILCLCSLAHWPWLRDAYHARTGAPESEPFYAPVHSYPVRERSLAFVLGELPYITYLYERSRRELLPDENLSIDGIKELVIESRGEWLRKHEPLHNWVTPLRLQVLLQYVRNLTLMNARLTPDLYTLALAAKQVCGDTYAVSLVETAKLYPFQHIDDQEGAAFGVGKASFPAGDVGVVKNRLEGAPVVWKNLPLKRIPEKEKQTQWRQRWNPFGICSWPPEDRRIESFNTHVRETAQALIGAGLARSEKFTSSLKDGLDIRETFRNWYTNNLYVKEIPPSRGTVEMVVFLFDLPADPQKYTFCTTWYAEHEEESTLSFYSTPIGEQFVGPGVAQCLYGGCFFLFPPRYLPDIWREREFMQYHTLEERLLAGAFFHSEQKNVAVVSPRPPLAAWKLLARKYRKKIIPIPLSRFSQQLVDRLRVFHVLNGKVVRSYAGRFIREM
ncbi:MAG: hypothetical protein C4527_14445 [Candidatus Omnitrophota bacterium]|jgi:hypothetical protein|nr:MAG: hypothetical protein C4527_14445 [Candidatus Omnitrophota bacterium]